ncbi:MAG: rod shape-determining protein MreC [Actinomycetes bacterium]
MLVLLLLTALTLLTLDYQRTGQAPLDGLRGAASAVFGPIERAAGAVVHPLRDLVGSLSNLGGAQDRIKQLQSQVDKLTLQQRTSDLDRTRLQEMDDLFHLAGLGGYRVVPARVVGVSAHQDFSWSVTIDAGSRDGLTTDMTVISGAGLVGRTTQVGPWTSTVVMAADPDSNVGVRVEGSMDLGYVTGGGDGPLQLTLLGGQSRLQRGSRLVTQGSINNRPYVPGVPVGEVIDVRSTPGSQTKTATVRPYVDFSSVDVVGVVVAPPRTNPRDSVLPPRPTTATP